MSRKRHYSTTSMVEYTFIGIALFLLVLYPLFGASWRARMSFSFGFIVNPIFVFVGNVLLIFGGIMFVWGLLTIFCGRSLKGVKIMVEAVLILILAGMFLDFSFIQFFTGNDPTLSRGYQ